MWFNFHPPRPSGPDSDDWIGDDIYLAIILFGIGGTAISVVGLTLLSLLVGENTVRYCCSKVPIAVHKGRVTHLTLWLVAIMSWHYKTKIHSHQSRVLWLMQWDI